jgi:hypothetical protein
MQLLAQNRVRDLCNNELKKLNLYAIEVQVSREMVPELREVETDDGTPEGAPTLTTKESL